MNKLAFLSPKFLTAEKNEILGFINFKIYKTSDTFQLKV